jgi:hypothetical protein
MTKRLDELTKTIGKKRLAEMRTFAAKAKAKGKSADEVKAAIRARFAKEIAKLDPETHDVHVVHIVDND